MFMKPRKTLHRNIFIISIAALALVSVGFSSWFIGQNITQREISLGISVETSDVKAVITDADVANKSIELDETSEKYSLGYTSSITIDESVSSFDYNLSLVTKRNNQDTNSNSITVLPNQSTFRKVSSQTSFNYFTLTGVGETDKDNITFTRKILTSSSDIDKNTYPGFYLCNIAELEQLGLGYGSYFEFKNPQVYYQTKLDSIKDSFMTGTVTRDYYINALSEAKKELQAFKDHFQNVAFVIRLETTNVTYK